MIDVDENVRLDGKTVVITGATSGIGKYVALDFYRRGGKIVLLSLTRDEGMETVEFITDQVTNQVSKEAGELVIREIDLSSLESVKACSQEILTEQIDILVNNAGIYIPDQPFSKDGYQIHFAVNYLGHALLTLLLLPRILQSQGRIVNTASVIHYLGRPLKRNEVKKEIKSPTKAYAISKFLIVMFTKGLARKLEGTGVKVFSVHPGLAYTPMSARYMKSFNLFLRTLIRTAVSPIAVAPSEAAKAILYSALDGKLNSENGSYYSKCFLKETASKTNDHNQQKTLWEMTIELLDIEEPKFFTEY